MDRVQQKQENVCSLEAMQSSPSQKSLNFPQFICRFRDMKIYHRLTVSAWDTVTRIFCIFYCQHYIPYREMSLRRPMKTPDTFQTLFRFIKSCRLSFKLLPHCPWSCQNCFCLQPHQKFQGVQPTIPETDVKRSCTIVNPTIQTLSPKYTFPNSRWWVAKKPGQNESRLSFLHLKKAPCCPPFLLSPRWYDR